MDGAEMANEVDRGMRRLESRVGIPDLDAVPGNKVQRQATVGSGPSGVEANLHRLSGIVWFEKDVEVERPAAGLVPVRPALTVSLAVVFVVLVVVAVGTIVLVPLVRRVGGIASRCPLSVAAVYSVAPSLVDNGLFLRSFFFSLRFCCFHILVFIITVGSMGPALLDPRRAAHGCWRNGLECCAEDGECHGCKRTEKAMRLDTGVGYAVDRHGKCGKLGFVMGRDEARW